MCLRPLDRATPEIYALKRVISLFQQDREVAMYCDLHGHSKMFNCFIYGCDPSTEEANGRLRINYGVRLFPYRLSQVRSRTRTRTLPTPSVAKREDLTIRSASNRWSPTSPSVTARSR